MKIDWKKKLTSRKFWAAVVGFVVPLLLTSRNVEPFPEDISDGVVA